MLRISKLADYATVVMVCLARHEQGVLSSRDIAEQTHLKLPTVSKLLKCLVTAGLLTSVRGVLGGYRLQRAPRDISVAEILYALDESRGLTECTHAPYACPLQGSCHIQGNWRTISEAITQALDSVSLYDLSRPRMPLSELERIKQLAMGVHRGK